MAYKFGRVLRRITDNPWLNVAVGLIVLVTGAIKMLDDLEQDVEDFVIGVHHTARWCMTSSMR